MPATINEKGRTSAKGATQATTGDDTAARSSIPHYGAYESLKTSLTACATTSAEYERACRLAADLAGV